MHIIEHSTFDEERAFYGADGILLRGCRFDGPADGESALKEAQNIEVEGCYFNLRYPFWHDRHLHIVDTELTPLCRAALWYSQDFSIENSRLHGTKALRECQRVTIRDCDVISAEFGWSVSDITLHNTALEGEYVMLRSQNMTFSNVTLKGKYSFQYIENATFDHCDFQTKDAFWHAKHVTVKNSTIRGEYLAWYAEDITFENCIIIGTQPLCYCKGLVLINCEMREADLCFEKSHVTATLTAPVVSIKNPASGIINLPAPCPVIMDDPTAHGQVIVAE